MQDRAQHKGWQWPEQTEECMLWTGYNYAPSVIIFANFSSDSNESHQLSLLSYTKHFSTYHYQRAK